MREASVRQSQAEADSEGEVDWTGWPKSRRRGRHAAEARDPVPADLVSVPTLLEKQTPTSQHEAQAVFKARVQQQRPDAREPINATCPQIFATEKPGAAALGSEMMLSLSLGDALRQSWRRSVMLPPSAPQSPQICATWPAASRAVSPSVAISET